MQAEEEKLTFSKRCTSNSTSSKYGVRASLYAAVRPARPLPTTATLTVLRAGIGVEGPAVMVVVVVAIVVIESDGGARAVGCVDVFASVTPAIRTVFLTASLVFVCPIIYVGGFLI